MSARALLNRVEAHLLDGLDAEGRADILFAISDPDQYAAVAAERQEQERKEQDAQRRQMFLDVGGEIG